MKIASILITLGITLSTFAQAQSSLTISGTGPILLSCDFSKSFAPSSKMVELTNSNNLVAHCAGNGQAFEIAFVGVKFSTNADLFQKQSIMNLDRKSTRLNSSH